LVIILAFLLCAWLAASITGLYIVKMFWQWLKKRREAELKNLRAYHCRLSALVSEMIAQANELDQHRMYLGTGSDGHISAELGKACQDLVILSDSLPLTQTLLLEGNLGQVRRDTLVQLSGAFSIARRLQGVHQRLESLSDVRLLAEDGYSSSAQDKDRSSH
jgi:hypothetical protein